MNGIDGGGSVERYRALPARQREAEMSHMPVVAVGVDESQSSHRALAWAAEEALRRGATLHVVTAWSWDAVEGAPLAPVDPASLMDLAVQTQTRAVAEIVDVMDPRPPVTRDVVQASAAEALADASQDADLVVVGTHGRGPVRSLLLGSVSLSVIKHAACPVVVMPPVHVTDSSTTSVVAGHSR